MTKPVNQGKHSYLQMKSSLGLDMISLFYNIVGLCMLVMEGRLLLPTGLQIPNSRMLMEIVLETSRICGGMGPVLFIYHLLVKRVSFLCSNLYYGSKMYKLIFQSDFCFTFQVIYMIYIVSFLQFC